MSSRHGTMRRRRRLLTGLAVVGVASLATAGLAAPADLKDLVDSPNDYLEKDIEVTGYCVKGGVNGDVLGYECTTDGAVYIIAGKVEPELVTDELKKRCSKADVKARKEDCGATIRFAPHSFTTSAVIEPGKTITIFNTDKIELSF